MSRSPIPGPVLITGSSTGLGLDTALFLAKRGVTVYATVPFDSDVHAVEVAARQNDVSLRVLRLDVTDLDSIKQTVRTIVAEFGSIYGLVNNAGLGLRGCFEDVTDEEIRRVFDVNLFGAMAVTREVLPSMRSAGRGRIIHITSIGGRIASFGLTGYCSTKFALEGFGEALALEVTPFGIHSIMIEPGIINTPHWTLNRGTAKKSLDPTSTYYDMFERHETFADKRTTRSRITGAHVAETILTALTARNPRMRYVVGVPPAVIMLARRYVPEKLFDAVYFGILLRRVIGRPRRLVLDSEKSIEARDHSNG